MRYPFILKNHLTLNDTEEDRTALQGKMKFDTEAHRKTPNRPAMNLGEKTYHSFVVVSLK